jgi:hypothetical protein
MIEGQWVRHYWTELRNGNGEAMRAPSHLPGAPTCSSRRRLSRSDCFSLLSWIGAPVVLELRRCFVCVEGVYPHQEREQINASPPGGGEEGAGPTPK